LGGKSFVQPGRSFEIFIDTAHNIALAGDERLGGEVDEAPLDEFEVHLKNRYFIQNLKDTSLWNLDLMQRRRIPGRKATYRSLSILLLSDNFDLLE
jgi:hypothetical protein